MNLHFKTNFTRNNNVFYCQSTAPSGWSLAVAFLLLLVFSACKKDRVELEWTEQATPTTDLLTQVHFVDDLNGHIVGGDTWYYGLYLHTQDGGAHWELDTLSPKLLFGLHFRDEMAYTIGIDGNFLTKKDRYSDWKKEARQGWKMWRDVAFYEADNGLIAGGEAYQKGYISRIDETYKLVSHDTFPHEISAVCFSDAQTAHAVGYGVVLQSKDKGTTWEYKAIRDDFYRDICFPTAQTGYAIGSVGNIIKTTDGGESWEIIRNGNRIAVSDKAFRAVYFKDAQLGYVVGDGGTFWRTENGGEHWQEVKDFPAVNLYDVAGVGDGGFVVGEGGRVFRFLD